MTEFIKDAPAITKSVDLSANDNQVTQTKKSNSAVTDAKTKN